MGILQKITEYFFPPKCVGCGREGYNICPECVQAVSGAESGKTIQLEYFERIFVFAEWDNPLVKTAVKKLKFRYAKNVLENLKHFFEENYPEQEFPKDSIFVPVPLHTIRENQRGYNQSQLAADIFSHIFCGELRTHQLIRRVKITKAQSTLNAKDRQENIRGAFAVEAGTAEKFPFTTPIVLVDDVVTTGSTLVEAARILKEYGYQKIWGVVIA